MSSKCRSKIKSTYFKTCATVFGPNHWPMFLPSDTPMEAGKINNWCCKINTNFFTRIRTSQVKSLIRKKISLASTLNIACIVQTFINLFGVVFHVFLVWNNINFKTIQKVNVYLFDELNSMHSFYPETFPKLFYIFHHIFFLSISNLKK